MLHIRLILAILVGLVLLAMPVLASDYQFAFSSCPTSAQAQTCPDDDRVCGLDGGITYCSDPTAIIAPSANTTTYSTNNIGGGQGGYHMDCESYDGSAPMCDEGGAYLCERNDTFHGSPVNRNTICVGTGSGGDFGISAEGICKTEGTDYWDCYGDTNCESTATSDCENSNNNHYTTATCNTGLEGGAAGTCVCDTNKYACDGSETDPDGCEESAGEGCFTGGNHVLNQCVGSVGNCTNYITSDSDCDDDDLDGNLDTCNAGNGCEIGNGDPCGNSTGTYEASQCLGATGNCTNNLDHRDCDNDDSDSNEDTCNGVNGCEVDPGDTCETGGLSGTVADQCPYLCEVDDVPYGVSGIENIWSGSNPFLWFRQLGSGFIANFTGNSGSYWILDKDANVDTSGNLTMGEKITFSFGNVIQAISSSLLRIEGDLHVTNNINASNYTLNGTTINDWGEVGGSDGQGLIDTDGFYVYDNGTRVFLNETKLNESTDARSLNQSEVTGDGNITVTATGDAVLISLTQVLWSQIQGTPNIIYGIWSGNNVDGILVSNGTAIGINQTAHNDSITAVGDTRYINLAGTNANQNINVSPYIVYAGSFDGNIDNTTILYSTETMNSWLIDVTGCGVLDAITVSEGGALNVTWTDGEVYVNGSIIETDANSTGYDLVANSHYWIYATKSGGSTLQVSTTEPSEGVLGEKFARIADLYTNSDDIIYITTEPIISEADETTHEALDEMLSEIVISGLITSSLDTANFSVTPGVYYLHAHDRTNIASALYSNSTSDYERYYHNTSGDWVEEEDVSGIPWQFWDDGTGLEAMSVSKWYVGWILIEGDGKVEYVYPQTEHSLEQSALDELKVYPPNHQGASIHSAKIVFKGSETDFDVSKAYFVDIRPSLGTTGGGGASSQNLWLQVASDSGSTTADDTTDTLTIAGDGNITTSISGDTVFISLTQVLWSQLQNIPNIIYGLWDGNNVDGILISNGTAVGINSTALNETVIQIGLDAGFNNTDGVGIDNNDNATLDNLNITGSIDLQDNATITRTGTNTSLWITETGIVVERLG